MVLDFSNHDGFQSQQSRQTISTITPDNLKIAYMVMFSECDTDMGIK